MASSLEDLLAEDGFRGRKSLARSRTSLKSESPNLPPFPFPDRFRRDFMPRDRIRTERTRSDVSRHSTRGESPMYDTISGSARPRDNLVKREKIVTGPKKEGRDKHETEQVFEIVEAGDEENERVKDIYSNEEKYSNRVIKEMEIKDKIHGRSKKHVLGRRSFSDKNMRSMKQKHETSDHKASSNGKSFEETQVKMYDNEKPTVVNPVSEPALDEVAIQAMVSILSGYIKRFLRDKEFRSTLRDNCFSSLNFVQVEEGNSVGKIIAKLEEAIEAIEKAVEEAPSTKDLRKAVLQLRVIVGLNSSDLKNGFTSGDYKLSACAHLYLSVVYKLQRKDRVAAKHLLQVFCDSPNQAREKLLPELWDYLFFPHLSHLKVWYNQEANSLADSPGRPRKLQLLEKVYNEIVDSGTYQFAVYYKDWLTEGVETTPVPSIHVPSISIREIQKGNSSSHGHSSEQSSSPVDPFSPQPMMVSKKFYNALFSQSSKPGSEDGRDKENSDNRIRSSDGSAVVKEIVKETNGHEEEDFTNNAPEDEVSPQNGLSVTSEEKWSFPGQRVSTGRDFSEKFVNPVTCQETTENSQMIRSPPQHTKENELTLKRLAKSLFELQQPDSEASTTHTLVHLTKVGSASEELHGVYFEERASFSIIPQDFICPLTGQLFEDPVTLETGQTFEREAIKAWFDQGNRACPVTGKALECKLVPFTNLVLKRLVDTWKSQHCGHLLEQLRDESETATLVLEQLLLTSTAFTKEESITNAKLLISLGGLHFLLQRFECGDLREKTRVAALVVRCIEAVSSVRNRIARDIDSKCVLEMLHSKQVKARANVVALLIELICLKRKKDVMRFLSGLQNENEGIESTMHVLLVYLQSCPPPKRPLVAVLLLYLDVLVEPRKYSIYREEAVDAITEALDASLADEKIRENCCRALLILGGRFSSSGKLLTYSWILNQAGFNVDPTENSPEIEENVSLLDDASSLDDDEQNIEEWLRNLSTSLLGNGKRSFVEAISKCIGSENLNLVKVCLTTVAWLSSSLASMSETELHLPAFSALISRLKDSLENGHEVEHKVLASCSLLNFSKISESIRDPLC